MKFAIDPIVEDIVWRNGVPWSPSGSAT